MSNIVPALPNTLIPLGPDKAGSASNLHPGKGISNNGDTKNLNAEQAQTYRPEEQLTVENRPNNDTDTGGQINEGKSENFQEVLQRQISEESDQKEGPSDDKKSGSHKTDKTSDGKSSEKTEVILPCLLEAQSQVMNTTLSGKGKSKAGSTVVNNEKTTLVNNSGKENMPQQITVSVSSHQTGESKVTHKLQSKLTPDNKEQNTKGLTAKDIKTGMVTIQGSKGTEAKNNNENQAAIVNPNPGNIKDGANNEKQAAVVVDPNPGNGKVIISDENSAIIKNDQTSTQPKFSENVPKPKPTASQIIETPKTAVIDEKINSENIKPSTEPKSVFAEDIKVPQITEKLNNIQTDSAGKKQNTFAGNDKQAVLNNNNTTSQKIDADDINISYARAQNDSIVVNGPIKTSSVLVESVNSLHNISSVANVSNTAVSNFADSMNNTGNINANTPGEQIIQNLQNNPVGPDREINISLNPPELGRIRITFQQTDGEITGLLEVEKAQARYDVEKSLPQIIASLQENGVQVQRINVVLDEQSQSDQPKNSFTGDFEGTENQEFSGKTRDNKSDGSKPGSSGSTLDGDFQQARQNVGNEISDDAISAYA